MEAAPHPWPAIGTLMLRDGYVTKEQLEEVLHAQHDSPQQRISGWRLGELLVERGLMTQGQVAQLVAEQYELPYMDLDESRVDRGVLHMLPADLVDRFSALPIEMLPDGTLVLAVSDPATVLFSDELRRAVGRPLKFTVVAPDDMEAVVAALGGEPAPERPSLSVAPWPSGAPAFGFPDDEGSGLRTTADANGSVPAATGAGPPLGTLLVRDGLLTEDELENALSEQRESGGKRLGEILVERGTLTRADVARVVAEQYELPFVDLAALELDHRVGGLLPLDVARRYSALPLDFLADGSLRVAVADPTKVLSPEEILASLGARLSFAVADPDLIDAAIEAQAEVESQTAIAWASFGAVGPPVSGTDERTPVDASDLIIIPAEEATIVDAEALERRVDQEDEHAEGGGRPASEAPLELAAIVSSDVAGERDDANALSLAQDDAMQLATDVPAPRKRKRRWLFGRRKDDRREELAGADPQTAEVSAATEDSGHHPISGLLRAGEAAAADEPTPDSTPQVSEQAAVLRMWIEGDDASAVATTADADTESEAPEAVEASSALVDEASHATWLDPVDTAPSGEPAVPEHDEPHLADEGWRAPAFEADNAHAGGIDEPDHTEPLGARDAAESALEEPTTSPEATFESSGLPEAVEDAVEDTRVEASEEQTAEPWNIFAPASAVTTALGEALGEEDTPPAETHVESELDAFTEPLAEPHDPYVHHETLALDDHALEPVAREDAATGAADATWQDAVPVASEEETTDVVVAPSLPVADAHADVDVETESQTQVDEPAPHVPEPSWLSWEPPAGSADPWPAPGADEETVPPEPAEPTLAEAATELELEEDGADDSSASPPADGAATHVEAETRTETAWLEEIEPDGPDAQAPSWDLEEPSLGLAQLEPLPLLHAEPAPTSLEVEPSLPETAEVVAEQPDRGTLAPLVERATALGASTVHFSAQEHGVMVRARIDGVLRKLDTITGQARFELDRELGLAAQSGTYAGGLVTALPTPHGDTVTIRFRPTGDAATLESLSLDPADREAVERALGHPFGLVLVAGPAGSGQATTLSAVLRELASGDRAVMTIEDPILHVVPGVDQVAVDHSAGRGYAGGLRTLLAADPDAILVGELADEETARLALDAATGHLVVTTVLAQTAVGALDRLALLGVDSDLVASTLSLVVAQRLVRQLCDHCREGYYASPADVASLRRPEDEIGRRLLARGTGCAECGGTGFSGTIGIFEVLVPNDEVRDLVAASAPAAEIERAARLAGKRTLADDAVRLCLEGLTTVAEVQRVLGRALR